MDLWMGWLIVGIVLILSEFVIPGGIVVFLGLSALVVSLGFYFQLITNHLNGFLTWFIVSIFLMLFLRSLFIRYFEGDSSIQNVDEDSEILGSIVLVVEDIFPYKDGRVKFRDSTWSARSEDEIKSGDKALIENRDGNYLIVKSILNSESSIKFEEE